MFLKCIVERFFLMRPRALGCIVVVWMIFAFRIGTHLISPMTSSPTPILSATAGRRPDFARLFRLDRRVWH